MKTKMVSLITLFAMMLSLSLCASATTVAPLWNGASRCTPVLTFSGSTANCVAKISADESSAKISATMTLYRVNSDGSLTRAASWSGLSGTGQINTSKSYPYAVSGATYRLTITGTVVDSSGSTPVSGYVEKKCP